MPMVVYTEDEVIDKCNQAAADAARDIARERDKAMSENAELRRKLNDCRDAIRQIVDSETIKSVCGWYTEIERARQVLTASEERKRVPGPQPPPEPVPLRAG